METFKAMTQKKSMLLGVILFNVIANPRIGYRSKPVDLCRMQADGEHGPSGCCLQASFNS